MVLGALTLFVPFLGRIYSVILLCTPFPLASLFPVVSSYFARVQQSPIPPHLTFWLVHAFVFYDENLMLWITAPTLRISMMPAPSDWLEYIELHFIIVRKIQLQVHVP